MRPAALGTLLGAAATALLAGCSGAPSVEAFEPVAGSADACTTMDQALPSTVLDQVRLPDAGAAQSAAWGDPAVTWRCGVERPDGLTRTSRCFGVADVDWFRERVGDADRYTTVGRALYVEVTVPDGYAPTGPVLVSFAAAVEAADPVVQPCV